MPKEIKIQRKRSPGSLEDARLIQWRALLAAEKVLFWSADRGNGGGMLSAVHAITQATQAYSRLTETAELQGQIDELKKELDSLREGVKLRKVI